MEQQQQQLPQLSPQGTMTRDTAGFPAPSPLPDQYAERERESEQNITLPALRRNMA